MSEIKPDNAATPGSPSSSSASPVPSETRFGVHESGATPAEPAASLPPSHEDAIQSPIKEPLTPAAEEAVARSSTDEPASASAVTPTAAPTARQRDAALARSSAAASTAKQEAEVHEREARRAGAPAARPEIMKGAGGLQGTASSVGTPSTVGTATTQPTSSAPSFTSSEPLAGELTPSADDTVAEETAATRARATGAPPAGFGAAPDFTAANPPPPNALPPSPPRYLRQSDSAWTVFGRIVAARARQLFDRAGQRITQRTLRIGVSARIFHPEPGAKGLRGKTLQYLEESIAHWVMSRDVLVFMIPTVGHQGMLHPSNIRLRDYAKHLDGLLLQGGADVSPQTYAEAASSHEWPGDRVRDMYELELLHEFIESGKPVLGVCRGCQLINVAFGGTLYQDIATDVPTAGTHVNENYEQHRHGIHFPDGSTLVNMFPGRRDAIVNSIHHQAVKTLGRDLNIEAVSASDGIIEAVRYRRAPFVMGVQWHPEFHRAGGPELLDCTPLLDTFLRVARETRF